MKGNVKWKRSAARRIGQGRGGSAISRNFTNKTVQDAGMRHFSDVNWLRGKNVSLTVPDELELMVGQFSNC